MTHHSSRLILFLLLLLITAYTVFFSVQLCLHYYSFGSRALDLGNMNQSIWNTLHGRPFHQTNQPGATNRLSLHVEPILLPLSLLYLFYSGPEILFVVQSLIVALGALPVFALARYKLTSDSLALVFAVIYLLFPAIQGATLLDFHAITLAPTFLLAAFYTLETGRPRLFGLFAILAVACKEDMTLLVMMLGFYALFINRQRRLGLVTVGLTAVWAFLAVFVIPPAFAGTDNIHWNRYDHLGETPLAIVTNFFLRPGLLLAHLQAVEALGYLNLLLAPTAYTALLHPITLLLALPSLGINLLSSFPPMQEVNALIYAAPIVPAVIISSIYGLANLQHLIERIAKRRDQKPAPLNNWLIALILLSASLIYHAAYGYLPGGDQFRGWEEVTDHHRQAGLILAQIPPEAALSAQDRLNPHAARRQTLYIFDRIEDADHIVLDVSEDSWPLHPVELRQRVDDFLGEGWGVVDGLDGYLLLARRPELPTTLPDHFYDFARVEQPKSFRPAFPTPVTFGDRLQLLGYDLSLGAHEEKLPVITLYWRAQQPLERDYRLWPLVLDRTGHIIEDTSDRPLVTTLWYPTSRWTPDEIILTRTLPRDMGEQFTIAVGVTEEDWSDPGQRLPVTAAAAELAPFENGTWVRLGAHRRTGPAAYEAIPVPAAQPTVPRQARFWDLIELQGVDLPAAPLRPGSRLPFTLYWQSAVPLTIDLTTFVHLLAPDGHLAAQLDWTPQDPLGYRPTTSWLPGRPVVDHQGLSLPTDLPPGSYRLVVGWYYPVTGDRLPLTAADTGAAGDVLDLGVVTIR